MNPMHIIFGLMIFNMTFSFATIAGTGQLDTVMSELTTSIGEQRNTGEEALIGEDGKQDFFMQEPKDATMNWLESLIKFGQIFGYFITIMITNTFIVSFELLSTGNVFITMFGIMMTSIFALVNFTGIYTVYKLLRNP